MAKNNAMNLDLNILADGFDIAGGTVKRKVTFSGGDMSLVGGAGVTHTFPVLAGTLATLKMEENTPFEIDVVLSADGKFSGFVQAGIAGPALVFGDFVYLDTSIPDWKLADADTLAASGTPMLGMCVQAASAGGATVILRYGAIRADAKFPTLNAGQIFASQTAGAVTNTAPTATDTITRAIGHALTGDAMFFNPSNDYLTRV